MVAFGTGLVLAVIGLLIVMGGLEDFNALAEDDQGTTSIFNFGIGAACGLVILCAVLMLGFGVFHVASNPKSAVKFLLGIVAIVGIVVIFAMTSSADTGKVARLISEGELSANTSKWINGGIWATLILMGIATLSFIFSEVRNVFK